ncbi:hypothetical protein B0E53_00572 [Micromonospora sp. MH33]|uniref:hypothetical protein n=1 Tax=Micromonospora sp. MH33 TaxID=1945509 RepID=UPI000D2F102F|nr:hypothetical protein [Micromonospora sp. MH33]PSK67453.1 hypothetical protein B0E53_00572 [Micromonospora sp. MH33]
MSREQDVRGRMVSLAEKLLQRTLDSGIRWIETDRDDQYLYPASNSGVTIERHEDRFEGLYYQLTLLNADGKAVQELSTASGDSEGERASWNTTLERLFDAARREALGIDSLIDDTLRDVEQGISKKEGPGRFGKKAPTQFDDPWASAAPPKARGNFDEEPPF